MYKLHAANAFLQPPGAVDLTDPQVLREDIDDLRWEMEQGYQRLRWNSTTRADSMQAELNTLNDKVTTLQEKVIKLESWKAQTETEMKNVNRELREKIQETNGHIYAVQNHANLLDDVVLQHHPESYKDLGYTLNEDATTETDVPRVTPDSESPTQTVP